MSKDRPSLGNVHNPEQAIVFREFVEAVRCRPINRRLINRQAVPVGPAVPKSVSLSRQAAHGTVQCVERMALSAGAECVHRVGCACVCMCSDRSVHGLTVCYGLVTAGGTAR